MVAAVSVEDIAYCHNSHLVIVRAAVGAAIVKRSRLAGIAVRAGEVDGNAEVDLASSADVIEERWRRRYIRGTWYVRYHRRRSRGHVGGVGGWGGKFGGGGPHASRGSPGPGPTPGGKVGGKVHWASLYWPPSEMGLAASGKIVSLVPTSMVDGRFSVCVDDS